MHLVKQEITYLVTLHYLLTVEEKKLDILVNNAGATSIPERLTVDGYESTFATNHLGIKLFYSCDCNSNIFIFNLVVLI